jgi:hypothetical protein
MEPLFAYFDPGSGSLLLQAIVGGAAGLAVFGKYLWDRIAASLRRNPVSGSEVSTSG